MFGYHYYTDNKAVETTDVDVFIQRKLIMQGVHDIGEVYEKSFYNHLCVCACICGYCSKKSHIFHQFQVDLKIKNIRSGAKCGEEAENTSTERTDGGAGPPRCLKGMLEESVRQFTSSGTQMLHADPGCWVFSAHDGKTRRVLRRPFSSAPSLCGVDMSLEAECPVTEVL